MQRVKKYYSNKINHNTGIDSVMLIEIPDPEVIWSVVVAFFVGMGGLYLFYKIRPLVKTQGGAGMNADRLDFYEKQLIDVGLRLDMLEMQISKQEDAGSDVNLREFLEKLVRETVKEGGPEQKKTAQEDSPTQSPAAIPGFEHNNLPEQVLHLITQKDMTSRDIQITLKRSREHISRLMKRLFEEGYVERTKTKPFAYHITQKGKNRISDTLQNVTAA